MGRCQGDILHSEMECLSMMMKIELDLSITIHIYTRDQQMLVVLIIDRMIWDLHHLLIEIKLTTELFKELE